MFVKTGVASSDPKETLGLPEASRVAHDDTIRRSRDVRIFVHGAVYRVAKKTHPYICVESSRSPSDVLTAFKSSREASETWGMKA